MTHRRARLTTLPLTIAAGALLLSACGGASNGGRGLGGGWRRHRRRFRLRRGRVLPARVRRRPGRAATPSTVTSLTPPGRRAARPRAHRRPGRRDRGRRSRPVRQGLPAGRRRGDRAAGGRSGHRRLGGPDPAGRRGPLPGGGRSRGGGRQRPARVARPGQHGRDRRRWSASGSSSSSPDAATTVEGDSAAFAAGDERPRRPVRRGSGAVRLARPGREPRGLRLPRSGLRPHSGGHLGTVPRGRAEPGPDARGRRPRPRQRGLDDLLRDPRRSQGRPDDRRRDRRRRPPSSIRSRAWSRDRPATTSSVMADNLATLVAGQSCT